MKKTKKSNSNYSLNMTEYDRMCLIGNLYVERDISKYIFERIERLRERAKTFDEPHSMVMIGETGMGKTTLLKKYLMMNPPLLVENCIIRPVLYVSLPAYTTIRGAAVELLRGMEVPGAERGTMVDRTHQILVQLKRQNVEVILVDEAQHVVEASGKESLPKVGDFFKDISKKAKVPFVLTGMPKIQEIFKADPRKKEEKNITQFGRLCSLENIGPFTAETDDEFLSFRRFLAEIDKKLPFPKRSRFGDSDDARLIFIATQGRICHVMNLIREAAVMAVKDGDDAVDRGHMMSAFTEVLQYQVPIDVNPFDPRYSDMVLGKTTAKTA